MGKEIINNGGTAMRELGKLSTIALLTMALIVFAAVGAAAGTSSAETYTKSDYTELALNESRRLCSLQLDNGAFAMNLDGNTAAINPYFCEETVIALLEFDESSQMLRRAEKYFDWHFQHLNQDGTINDRTAKLSGTKVLSETDTGTCDSVDSYAALFLVALEKYAEAGGNGEYIRVHSGQVEAVLRALLGCMNETGYTWAKPDYHVMYLMDNCEVRAGLSAAEYLYSSALADSGDTTLLTRVQAAIAFYDANFEKDWWDANHFRPTLANAGDEQAEFSWDCVYPDLTSQLYPTLYGLTNPDGERAQTVHKNINERIRRQTPEYIESGADAFCRGAFLSYAAMMQDSLVSSYVSEYERSITDTNGVYPLYCGDSAMALSGLDILDGNVIIADDGNDIQSIIDTLKPGDRLLLHEGKYDGGYIVSAKTRGSSDARITIASVPGETAVLSGEDQAEGTVLITLSRCKYVDIRNLTLCDVRGNDACGVLVEGGTSHFAIEDNEICGISCEGHSSANAVLLFGDNKNAAISNGSISDNYVHDCATGWGEALSVTGNIDKVDCTGNSVENTGNIGIDYSGNYGYCKKASADFPRNCVIANNIVQNCVSSYATSYGIYVDGGQHITVRSNTVTGCSGGIEVGAEKKPKDYKYSTRYIYVGDNVIKDNIENGITVGGYKKKLGWVRNVTIAGNLCENNGPDSLTLSKCNYVKITGNTFYNDSPESNAVYMAMSKKYTKHITFSKNLYGTTGCGMVFRGETCKTPKAWRKASGDKSGRFIE